MLKKESVEIDIKFLVDPNFTLSDSQQDIVNRITQEKDKSKYDKYEDMSIEPPDSMRVRRTSKLKYAAHRVLLSYLRKQSFSFKDLKEQQKTFSPATNTDGDATYLSSTIDHKGLKYQVVTGITVSKLEESTHDLNINFNAVQSDKSGKNIDTLEDVNAYKIYLNAKNLIGSDKVKTKLDDFNKRLKNIGDESSPQSLDEIKSRIKELYDFLEFFKTSNDQKLTSFLLDSSYHKHLRHNDSGIYFRVKKENFSDEAAALIQDVNDFYENICTILADIVWNEKCEFSLMGIPGLAPKILYNVMLSVYRFIKNSPNINIRYISFNAVEEYKDDGRRKNIYVGLFDRYFKKFFNLDGVSYSYKEDSDGYRWVFNPYISSKNVV